MTLDEVLRISRADLSALLSARRYPVLTTPIDDVIDRIADIEPFQVEIVLAALTMEPSAGGLRVPADMIAALLRSSNKENRALGLRVLPAVGPVTDHLIEVVIEVAKKDGAGDIAIGLASGGLFAFKLISNGGLGRVDCPWPREPE